MVQNHQKLWRKLHWIYLKHYYCLLQLNYLFPSKSNHSKLLHYFDFQGKLLLLLLIHLIQEQYHLQHLELLLQCLNLLFQSKSNHSKLQCYLNIQDYLPLLFHQLECHFQKYYLLQCLNLLFQSNLIHCIVND